MQSTRCVLDQKGDVSVSILAPHPPTWGNTKGLGDISVIQDRTPRHWFIMSSAGLSAGKVRSQGLPVVRRLHLCEAVAAWTLGCGSFIYTLEVVARILTTAAWMPQLQNRLLGPRLDASTCQSMVNTLQVDGLARISGLTPALYKAHPQPLHGVPRCLV